MASSASAARLLRCKMSGLVRVRVRARDRVGIRVGGRITVGARARIRVSVQRCAAFSDARLAFTPSISRWSIARAVRVRVRARVL